MLIIGCDFHTRHQQIAMAEDATYNYEKTYTFLPGSSLQSASPVPSQSHPETFSDPRCLWSCTIEVRIHRRTLAQLPCGRKTNAK